MGFFKRRRETLNEKLAREAGLTAEPQRAPEPAAAPAPREADEEPPAPFNPRPGFLPRGLYVEPAIIGLSRQREWDAVVSATAPEIEGDDVEFFALPDGSLIVDEERGDASLEPLANAVEEEIDAPYRARGVRKSKGVWAVSAVKIDVVQLRAEGDEIELVKTAQGTSLTVDGEHRIQRIADLERIGEQLGDTYAVHASRIDGDLFEVQANAL